MTQVVLGPVRAGRIRDVGWPPGLRAVVTAGLVTYAVTTVLVLLAAPLRASSELSVAAASSLGLPRGVLWVLIIAVAVTLALFLTATLHGPWWLFGVGLLAGELLLGFWGLQLGTGSGRLGFVRVATMVALLGFAIARRRRLFAWWEFCVVLVVVGVAFAAGLAQLGGQGAQLGQDPTAILLQSTIVILAFLASPAAFAAGVSVAEVTVSATLACVRAARRVVPARWAFVVLVTVIAIRVVQLGWYVVHLDGVRVGWPSVVATIALVALMTVVIGPIVVYGPNLEPGGLAERGNRLGLPIGAGLLALLLPVVVVSFGLVVVIALDPTGSAARSGLAPGDLFVSPLTTGVTRLALAVAVGIAAVVAIRRGRRSSAVLLASTAVMLVAIVPRFLTGYRYPIDIDPDVINAVATVAVLAAVGVAGLRRRLDAERTLAYAGALILSALFSSRDFVSDPVGTLIGVSGVALVLFGLTWDLLTGSEWANGSSRRFPLPSRVLLLLANAVLTVTVLGFIALSRTDDPSIGLDAFAALGDFVLGTAVLASAFAALLAGPDRAVGP